MSAKALIVGLLFGVPFGALMWLGYSDDVDAIGVGIASGLVAGAAVAGYVVMSDRRRDAWVKATCAKYEAEGIVHCGRASMPRPPLRDLDGLLVLTKQRLVFEPHRHNLLAKQREIAVDDIAGVTTGVGLWKNTLLLYMRDKRSLEIGVRHREEWLAKLPGVRSPS